MILQVVAVRDRATDSYANPVFCVALGEATRSFADEVNRESSDNKFFQHPEDFDLFHLGSFDTNSGAFDCGQPRQIAIGKDLIVDRSEDSGRLRRVK